MRRPSVPRLPSRPEADAGALPTASSPSDGGAPPSGPVGARSSLLVALGPRCGAVPCRARPQPSAKLKCSFATPRARPISMFSGARRVACGPEEKSEAGGSGMNIEIGGSGAPMVAEKTSFKFRGGMSRIRTSILSRGNAFPSAAPSARLPARTPRSPHLARPSSAARLAQRAPVAGPRIPRAAHPAHMMHMARHDAPGAPGASPTTRRARRIWRTRCAGRTS